MTKYRVISEPYRLDRFSPTVPTHRRVRGDDSIQRVVTYVDAPDVLVALNEAINLTDHRKHSITSVEEVIPSEALYFSDQELTDALLRQEGDEPVAGPETLHPDDYAGKVIYEQADFTDTVESVATILRDTLLPGLSITLVGDFDDNFTVLDLRDEATGTYRSTTADVKELIQDRSAIGWDGILSIAKALIAAAEPLV
ncbi:hypothetical protein ACVWY0_001098 [Arthrobacter sp. UYNi723]